VEEEERCRWGRDRPKDARREIKNSIEVKKRGRNLGVERYTVSLRIFTSIQFCHNPKTACNFA
jgi:hypothetical protein